jgi:hypothetical protein
MRQEDRVVKVWTKLVEKINIYNWEVIIVRVVIVTVIVLALLVVIAMGEELRDFGRTSQDVIRPNRTNVLDKDGDIVYYIERDRMDTRRSIIYNDKGKEVGVIEPDRIRPGGSIIRGTSHFRRFND